MIAITRIRLTTGICSWLRVKQWRSWVSPNRILRTLEHHSFCLSHSHMRYMRSHKWEARPWTKYPESQTFTLVPVWITQVLQVKPFSWQTLINSGMGPNSIYKNDLLWTYLYTVLCLLICLCGTLLSSLRGTNLFMLCDIFNVFLNSVCNHFIKDLWKLIHIVFVVITSLSGIGIRIAAFMGWVWCVVFDFMESFENYFCQLFLFSQGWWNSTWNHPVLWISLLEEYYYFNIFAHYRSV